MNFSDLNWLDWVLILILAASALDGTRRGLLLGTLDLVASIVGLGVAFVAERPVGDTLAGLVPSVPSALVHIGAFLGLLVIAQIVLTATVGRVVWAIARLIAGGPLGWLDRLLGMAPGLVRGAVTTTLFLLPFALLPFAPSISQGVEQSKLGNRMVGAALEVLPAIEAQLGQDLEGGLPSLVVAPPTTEGEIARPLPLGPPVGALQIDATAEQRMLDLVNQERSGAGLRPLLADEPLRQVARGHSMEMFQLDYFAHDSPTAGSPFDRMRAGGVSFLLAGENIAYAPNVEQAHQGLMNSPGHRANILRPEFRKVGIGIVRSQSQGSMFTQDFTN